jgi:hypothetical protein
MIATSASMLLYKLSVHKAIDLYYGFHLTNGGPHHEHQATPGDATARLSFESEDTSVDVTDTTNDIN